MRSIVLKTVAICRCERGPRLRAQSPQETSIHFAYFELQPRSTLPVRAAQALPERFEVLHDVSRYGLHLARPQPDLAPEARPIPTSGLHGLWRYWIAVTMSTFERKRNRDDTSEKDSFLSKRRAQYGVPCSGYDGVWALRQDNSRSRPKLSHDEYTVGWVAHSTSKPAAAQAMLDEVHESLQSAVRQQRVHSRGRTGQHNVVIACLPTDGYGANHAAAVGSNMDGSFPSIRVRLMVGIGGGAPGKLDLRLRRRRRR